MDWLLTPLVLYRIWRDTRLDTGSIARAVGVTVRADDREPGAASTPAERRATLSLIPGGRS